AAARGAADLPPRRSFPPRALQRAVATGRPRAHPGPPVQRAAAGRARAAPGRRPPGPGDRGDPLPRRVRRRHPARQPQPPSARGARGFPPASPGTAVNDSLGPVREVWAQRVEARTRADVLYLVYVVVLGLLVVGVPALRAAG